MIDHVAGLIIKNGKLLVLRKITKDNRKECILPGGKRENQETDEQTLRRELSEELNIEITHMEYFNTYFDKAVFETGVDFKQTTYLIKTEDEIQVRNEIKEALWIDDNYQKDGIVCNPTLEKKIIPDLLERQYLGENNNLGG